MDYTSEPPSAILPNVRGTHPFNAEPFVSSLVEFNITPEDLLYCRNHGPVRQFDEETYNLVITGTRKGDFSLSIKSLRSMFAVARVVATLQARYCPVVQVAS